MKSALFIFFCACLLSAHLAPAQEVRPVTLDPSDVEEIRRLIGRVADLEAMLEVQIRKNATLSGEVEALHRSLREAQEKNNQKFADFVSREELAKVYDKIKEVDDKRIADNKQMLEAIEKMVKELAKAPPVIAGTGNTDKPETKKPEKDLSSARPSANTNNELVYTHTVVKGEYLSQIVADYNRALKDQNKMPITLEMVRRVNPSINLNNIYVGQEILIPVPPDKK